MLNRCRWSSVTLLLLALATSGCCSWQSADGTRHTLIVGIGLVSTKSAPDQAASALRAHTLGLALSPAQGGLVLGYQSLQTSTITSDWQGLAQVTDSPGQPLTLEGYAPHFQRTSPDTQGETP